MPYDSCKLAELISTRISHDLAGGIGSLDNLIDCLEENVPVDAEDKKILDKTAKDLRARQKFLRIAFGIGTKALSTDDLKSLCLEYLQTIGASSRNISLSFKNIASELAKYICLCVMTAVEVAIKNTAVEIDVNKNNIIIKIASENKLSEAKLASYQQILEGKVLDDGDASQLIALIYLRELLGADVPMKLNVSAENNAELIIG